jgi:hypothetical protein
VLRPIGAPLPLGFLALAVGSLVLAGLQLHWMTNLLATVLIGTTAARFACAGVYELTNRTGWETATGVIGVVLTGLAWYAALALLLENVSGRPLLPTLRPASAATRTEVLANDLSDLATEPGVRHPA